MIFPIVANRLNAELREIAKTGKGTADELFAERERMSKTLHQKKLAEKQLARRGEEDYQDELTKQYYDYYKGINRSEYEEQIALLSAQLAAVNAYIEGPELKNLPSFGFGCEPRC